MNKPLKLPGSCGVEECERIGNQGAGFCGPHYHRYVRHGDPLASKAPRPPRVCRVCGDKMKARDLCGKHYKRWKVYGHTDDPASGTVEQSLQMFVRRGAPDECWLWTRALGGRAKHGQVWDPTVRKLVYAHRATWEVANGRSVPDGLLVRHTCDNPPCCNPAHLIVGTAQDNVNDTIERGRAAWQQAGFVPAFHREPS